MRSLNIQSFFYGGNKGDCEYHNLMARYVTFLTLVSSMALKGLSLITKKC